MTKNEIGFYMVRRDNNEIGYVDATTIKPYKL